MARASCKSEIAPSLGMRGQSVDNFVFVGVGNLQGLVQISYSLEY